MDTNISGHGRQDLGAKQPQILVGLTQLDMIVPPNPVLEEALGYTPSNPARYVAFYWEPAGDEAMFHDGLFSTDCNWSAYLMWTYIPINERALLPYHLGSSETVAKHWLLLDRETRQAYVGTPDQIQPVLHQQWPAVELHEDDIVAIYERYLESIDRLKALDSKDLVIQVEARMQRDRQALRRLETSLLQMIHDRKKAES